MQPISHKKNIKKQNDAERFYSKVRHFKFDLIFIAFTSIFKSILVLRQKIFQAAQRKHAFGQRVKVPINQQKMEFLFCQEHPIHHLAY